MIRNPFRKPYVFSKKWAIWLVVAVPWVLYTDLKDPSAKESDVVSTSLIVIVLFVLIPWILMRISRSVKGKTPQGKFYDDEGDVIDGHVLDLKLGYWPRVRVQARLVNGVVEIPTGKIAVGDIKSIKVKDLRPPRPLFMKIPLLIFFVTLIFLYFYFILQPLLLFIYIWTPRFVGQLFNNPQIITPDQGYEQLHKLKFFSHVVHSQALLQPSLIAFSALLLILVLPPLLSKTALVINTNDESDLIMPFSSSLVPFAATFVERARIKRFIKNVKKAQKRFIKKMKKTQKRLLDSADE